MWPFSRKSRLNFPRFVEEYRGLDFKVDRDLQINRGSYVVLDCETTGVTKADQIITIGAVIYENQSVKLDQLLDLKRTLSQSGEASIIHGELSNDLNAKEQELIESILRFLSNSVIVGHHISFDIQMIQQWIAGRYSGFKIKKQDCGYP